MKIKIAIVVFTLIIAYGFFDKTRKETLFIQVLEGLHKDEANLLCVIKDKKLHNSYKGLTPSVVKDAFGWNDDFIDPTKT